MVDLSNATFIIPLRIESSDRMRNIVTLLCYLFENFDTNVIVKRWTNLYSRRQFSSNQRVC